MSSQGAPRGTTRGKGKGELGKAIDSLRTYKLDGIHAGVSQVMWVIRVVLPAPFGPRKPKNSPSATVKLM